jgi:hypothetical protein
MSHWNINKILARSEKVVQYIQFLVGWPESGPQVLRGAQCEVGSLVVGYLTSITSRMFTRIVKTYERKKNTMALDI